MEKKAIISRQGILGASSVQHTSLYTRMLVMGIGTKAFSGTVQEFKISGYMRQRKRCWKN